MVDGFELGRFVELGSYAKLAGRVKFRDLELRDSISKVSETRSMAFEVSSIVFKNWS